MNNNVLLFGNGVSINFNEDFSLKYFFDLLKDKDKVKKLYSSFKKNLEDELKIIIDKAIDEEISNLSVFQFKRDEALSKPEMINIILSYNINVFRYFQKHNQDIFEIAQEKGFENSLTEFIKGFVSNQNFKKLAPFLKFAYGIENQNIQNEIINFLLNITTQFITNILCFYLLSLEEKTKENITEQHKKFLNFLGCFDSIYTLNYDNIFDEECLNKENMEIEHIHGHYCQSKELIQSKNCLLASAKKVNDNFYQNKIWNLTNVDQKINFYILGINTSNDIKLFNFLLNFALTHKKFNLYYSFFEQSDIYSFINVNKNLNNNNNNNIFLFNAQEFWKALENDQSLYLFKKMQLKPLKYFDRLALIEIDEKIRKKELYQKLHGIKIDLNKDKIK